MPAFTQTEFDLVNKAFEQASARLDNLEYSNEKRPSEIREVAIDTLKAHQLQIDNLGFFDKDDFTLKEIKAAVEAAAAIGATEDSLDDAHELTLMELASDFAQLIQKLALDEYGWMLRSHWESAKRYSRYLPDQIPEEVCDEFNVGVFNKTQGRLNQIAHNVREVSRRRCLNSDDYATLDFKVAVLNAGKYSAQEASDNYIALQKLKAAERAAREANEANEVSIGGQIWDVIGWDSPTDFLWDIGLFAVTGGASKVVRWGKRIGKLAQKADKAVSKLEKLLEITKRARRMEDRIQDVRKQAERLKKAKNILQLPNKIRDAFKILNSARGKFKLAEEVGSKVTTDYIRNVATSVAIKSTGLGGSAQIGEAASKELAKASIMAYLEGTPLGKEIKDLRGKINHTMIITGFNSKNNERLLGYFALLVTREFLARMTISFMHKLRLRAEYVISEFIDSALAALQKMLLDVPFIADAQLKQLGLTIMDLIRKTIAEIGKDLVKNLIAE